MIINITRGAYSDGLNFAVGEAGHLDDLIDEADHHWQDCIGLLAVELYNSLWNDSEVVANHAHFDLRIAYD